MGINVIVSTCNLCMCLCVCVCVWISIGLKLKHCKHDFIDYGKQKRFIRRLGKKRRISSHIKYKLDLPIGILCVSHVFFFHHFKYISWLLAKN